MKQTVLKALNLITFEYSKKNKASREWKFLSSRRISDCYNLPVQTDGSSCGLLVCLYAWCSSLEPNMDSLRKTIGGMIAVACGFQWSSVPSDDERYWTSNRLIQDITYQYNGREWEFRLLYIQFFSVHRDNRNGHSYYAIRSRGKRSWKLSNIQRFSSGQHRIMFRITLKRRYRVQTLLTKCVLFDEKDKENQVKHRIN